MAQQEESYGIVGNLNVGRARSRFCGGLALQRRTLTPDLHIEAASVLDRLEFAAADGARRYRLRILGPEPNENLIRID